MCHDRCAALWSQGSGAEVGAHDRKLGSFTGENYRAVAKVVEPTEEVWARWRCGDMVLEMAAVEKAGAAAARGAEGGGSEGGGDRGGGGEGGGDGCGGGDGGGGGGGIEGGGIEGDYLTGRR